MNASEVARALGEVYDPELGLDLVALGLVYAISCEPGRVAVEMTVTSLDCPMADAMMRAVGRALLRVAPDAEIQVDPVYEPPWNVEMLTDEGRRWLGIPPRTTRANS